MRILIIGGTHFMGPHVLRKLHMAGHTVTLFHRGQHRIPLPAGVNEILGDRDRLADSARLLKSVKPEIVLDMIISHEQHVHDLLEMFTGVTRRVVMISSQDVYQAFGRVNRREEGGIDLSPITEDSPLRANLYPYRAQQPRTEDDPQRWMDDYDKIPAERLLMSDSDLAGTILRLPAVYGPGDFQHRMFPYLKRMLDGRPAILLEECVANWRWTHGYVENVADAITLAVTNEQASGRIYNVGEPSALSVAERVARIAQAAHWHGQVITVPTAHLPETLREKANVSQPIVVESKRIREELGYSEHIDLEKAFHRTVAWESTNPPTTMDPGRFDYEAEDKVLAAL